MHKLLGTLLHFWAFSNNTQAQLLPPPNEQCWTRVSRIFSDLQHCLGWGERELQENFEKDSLFYKGSPEWQKKKEKKKKKKTEIYEYYITVRRTLVHDFRFEIWARN